MHSIDAGKYSVCGKTNEKKIIFHNKLDEGETQSYTQGKTFNIEYNGKKYILGEGASTSDFDVSKAKLCHKLAIYTAIALLGGDDVTILTGCPLAQFFNPDLKEQYKRYILDSRNIEIKIDGEYKHFKIKDVMIFPESCGIIYSNLNAFASRLIGVIDIGGLNTNGAIYERLKPIRSSIFTMNEGGNIINAKLKRELNTCLGANIQDYQIPFLLEDSKLKPYIDKIIREQINLIISECKKYNWDFSTLTIFFTGGGSLLMQKQIKECLPNAEISANPIWDNCNGYYEMGRLLCKV